MEAAAEDTPRDAVENPKPENPAPAEKRVPPVPEPTKKSKREDKKKDDKYVDQFTKAINSAPTVEEKIKTATEKYAHMVEDNKKLQFFMKQSEKRHALMVKEKEQLQHEFNKTVLVKSKLENLCRELQKQNKAIKDESLHKIREEEERRKETQAKFQNTLSEITALLQQNNEKNAKLRDDNISMTEKFKSVVQQYQLREQQVDKMSKQMALEQQLAEAKMQKASLEHQAERERITAEMEQLRMTVAQYRAKIQELHGTESGLRTQLAVYTDKYDEFQAALVKSNQVFGGFKDEMGKMSKKIKKLEKESLSWKKRWETSQAALLEMCGERQAREAAGRQLASMQSLCRTLQAERTLLLNTLKEHNIERPPLPALPPQPAPAPAPAPASDAKVDAMAANCAQLRQSLAHLQSQLNVLTNKQTDEPPKQEKPKKTKSKKSKKQDVKDSVDIKEESDSNTNKEADSAEIEPSVEGAKEQLDIADEKVDDKTLESLIEAISNANIDISDLEVDNNINVEEVLNNTSDNDNLNEINTKIKEIEGVVPNITEIGTVEPKIVEIGAVEPKVTEVEAVKPKVIEIGDVEPKVTEVEAVKPKVIEIGDVEPKVTEVEAVKPKVIEIGTVVPKITEVEAVKPKVIEIGTVVPKITEIGAVKPKVTEVKPKVIKIGAVEPKITEIGTIEPKITEVGAVAPKPKVIETVDPKTTEIKLADTKVTEIVAVDNLSKGEPQKVEDTKSDVNTNEATKPDVLQNVVLEKSDPQINGS